MIVRDLIFRTSKHQQTIREHMEMGKVESFEEQNHVFYRTPAVKLPLIDRGEGIYLFDKSSI